MWYALGVKPHPRIRKTVKWGGAAVTVLLGALWLGSAAGQINFIRFPYIVSFNAGVFGITVADDDAPSWPREFTFGVGRFDGGQYHFAWWFWGCRNGNSHEYAMPLWVVVGGSALVTVFAWRLDTLARRRARLNLCPKCNYDRAGLAPGAVCPECGLSAPTSPASSV